MSTTNKNSKHVTRALPFLVSLLLISAIIVTTGCEKEDPPQVKEDEPIEKEAVKIEDDFICGEELTDQRDDNVYKTIKLGDQCWMGEKLRYLPEVMSSEDGSKSEPRYYVYDYEGTNVEEAKETENHKKLGVLYNWPAAMNGAESSKENPSGVQGVCPEGWHLPSDSEWAELESYLAENGYNYDGSVADPSDIMHLKRQKISKSMAATTNWEETSQHDPKEGAVGTDLSKNNSSGFTALPAGLRLPAEVGDGGNFTFKGLYANWWTATAQGEDNPDTALSRDIAYYGGSVGWGSHLRDFGYSVRCVYTESR